ncbi:glycosyltransferase-like domain-containing protein 1 isoform X2 [Mytilus californianus]|uniref:glycosyltransferase-like domain-containing protein 1 isoform X2 n=1 Tax=Mytilus californianus TaxID=6549 RepID=UPI0022460ABE|nr:glycosyltransferase-like domain-containing protein 1 isoform X2 [Mytilus californianus]XP_052095515.1 glycosyltransferase-like domain-containing protein 1 isoform X2 [Mytilus californianus]
MKAEVLIIEPFYGGSHKQMVDLLQSKISDCEVMTMKAKKWHWRARTGALYLSQQIPYSHNYRTLFASSVLNLAELIALRPDLQGLTKILYFHENQLVYPIKKQQDRDFQYGYNQIISCMVADTVVFNSKYNMESFLSSIRTFLNLIPDHRPKALDDAIRPKCQVLYFPLDLSDRNGDQSIEGLKPSAHINNTDNILSDSQGQIGDQLIKSQDSDIKDKEDNMTCAKDPCSPEAKHNFVKPLHIVWAHRWEHDKDPDTFFEVVTSLSESGREFDLSVLGEQYTDIPEVFDSAKEKLQRHIVNWGYQESRKDYIDILKSADVVVSTALHEFFGVSMLEAVYYGCYPMCPNRLVYPEIFPGTSRKIFVDKHGSKLYQSSYNSRQ